MSRNDRTKRGLMADQTAQREQRVSRVVEVVRRAGKTGILTSDVCDEVAARIPVKNEVSRTLSLASKLGLVVKDGRNGVDHRWFAVETEVA